MRIALENGVLDLPHAGEFEDVQGLIAEVQRNDVLVGIERDPAHSASMGFVAEALDQALDIGFRIAGFPTVFSADGDQIDRE